MSVIIPLLCTLHAVTAQPTTTPEVLRFALVIGQNAPDGTSSAPLRFADDDAVAIHRVLVDAGAHAVLLTVLDADSARMHPDAQIQEPPTLAAVIAAMETLHGLMEAAKATSHQVEFHFFYSGHGNVENGEGYVVLEGGRLTRSDLRTRILQRSPADLNHVIVDACKSYYFIHDKGPGGERERAEAGFSNAAYQPGANTGFMLSTSTDRESHEWEHYQAGVFSHELRSALRGAADANLDGRVSYAEVGAFLDTANSGIANPGYRPDFFIKAPVTPGGKSGPATAALTWPAPPDLWVDDQALGHIYVEDAQGLRLLDVHPARGQTLGLRLPSQRPLFIRPSGDQVEFVLQGGGQHRLSELERGTVDVARKGALHLAFLSLFGSPFGQAQVDAYTLRSAELSGGAARATSPSPRANIVTGTLLTSSAVGVGLSVFLAAGCALSMAAAAQRNFGGQDASQLERQRRNVSIIAFNVAALVSVGAAVLVALLSAALLAGGVGMAFLQGRL